MLSDVRTVWASFLSFVVFRLQYFPLVELSRLPRSVLEHLLSSDDAIFALGVGALDEDKPFFDICVDYCRYASGTDSLLAALSLRASAVDSVVADDACIHVTQVDVNVVGKVLRRLLIFPIITIEAIEAVCWTHPSG